MAKVELQNISKSFGDTLVIDDCSLKIGDKEFLVLVGPSGCGKSTLLRIVAGLEKATNGEVLIGAKDVSHLPPKDRDIAMVFQNYALYPHMNVYKNMAFGLRMNGYKKNEIDKRVMDAAAILELGDLLGRKPAQLSGGQRQRVAMGRAIVRKPQVFLFDEPLSNLDAKLRVQMRREIKRLHEKLQATIIYVTHDQVEAMTLAGRIAIINNGEILQVAPPEEVYSHPANAFVAGFIGSPAMNFVPAKLLRENGKLLADAGSFQVLIKDEAALDSDLLGKEIILGFRPEQLLLQAENPANYLKLAIDIELVEPLGSSVVVSGKSGQHSLCAILPAGFPISAQEKMEFYLKLDEVKIFDAETGRSLSAN
jgi:multiple sugar transport system ATP-binding protein